MVLVIAPLNSPSWAPSKAVIPIAATTIHTEARWVAQWVAAARARRRPSRPRRTSSGASRENIPR